MSNPKPSRKPYSGEFNQLQADGITKKLIQVRHYEYKNKNMTIKDIEKFAIEIRKRFIAKDKNALVQLVIQTPFGDRSGKFHRGGQFRSIKDNEIHVWNPTLYQYDSVGNKNEERIKWYNDGKAKPKAFYFNVIYTNNKGGEDKHNDCLYNCLKQVLGTKFTDIWEHPNKLKRSLKIERDDMVNAEEHVDIIEKRLKCQMFISGDITRIPKINAKTQVHLILQNSHYKVEASNKPKIQGVSSRERIPITYYYNKETDDYIFYDGINEYRETVYTYRKLKELSSPNVLIGVSNKDDLKNEYDIFKDQADKLKEQTDGLINMYKTGTIKATALKLFEHFTKSIEVADKIQGVEGEFILDTYRGGLMFAKPYKGKAYKYDITSMYPSIMSSKMTFPYKQGEFKILTKSEMGKWLDKDKQQYFRYGIYRAIITGDIQKAIFRQNELNHYTHLDLEVALKEGYNIELIEDGSCNFLYYPPATRISGTQLFKDYVDLLYPIKQEYKDIHYAKPLLNILWGALSEKRIYNELRKRVGNNDVLDLDVNENITNTVHLDNGDKIYETEKSDDLFVSGFARIMPFITAKGRQMMANLIAENIDVDSVVRIHTDGIITSGPLKNKVPNKKDAYLGQIGVEGYCDDCEVVNMASPKGKFNEC